MTIGRAPAAWYPDPAGRHQHRYWDGERWTLHVADAGVPSVEGPAPAAPATPAVPEQPTAPSPPIAPATAEQPYGSTTPRAPVLPSAPAAPTTPSYEQTWATTSAIDPRLQRAVEQQAQAAATWQQQQVPYGTAAPSADPTGNMYSGQEWTGTSAPWATASGPPTHTAPAAPSSTKRAWILVAAIAIAVIAAGVTGMIAFAGGSDDHGSSNEAVVERYPAAIETNFIRGCTATGGPEDYCRCALDRLEHHYDLGEFADAEASYLKTGTLPDDMKALVLECVSKLQQQKT